MTQASIITSRQAAELLGVSMATIARLVKRGDLDGHKLTPAKNSPLRITRTSLDELLERRKQPG